MEQVQVAAMPAIVDKPLNFAAVNRKIVCRIRAVQEIDCQIRLYTFLYRGCAIAGTRSGRRPAVLQVLPTSSNATNVTKDG